MSASESVKQKSQRCCNSNKYFCFSCHSPMQKHVNTYTCCAAKSCSEIKHSFCSKMYCSKKCKHESNDVNEPCTIVDNSSELLLIDLSDDNDNDSVPIQNDICNVFEGIDVMVAKEVGALCQSPIEFNRDVSEDSSKCELLLSDQSSRCHVGDRANRVRLDLCINDNNANKDRNVQSLESMYQSPSMFMNYIFNLPFFCQHSQYKVVSNIATRNVTHIDILQANTHSVVPTSRGCSDLYACFRGQSPQFAARSYNTQYINDVHTHSNDLSHASCESTIQNVLSIVNALNESVSTLKNEIQLLKTENSAMKEYVSFLNDKVVDVFDHVNEVVIQTSSSFENIDDIVGKLKLNDITKDNNIKMMNNQIHKLTSYFLRNCRRINELQYDFLKINPDFIYKKDNVDEQIDEFFTESEKININDDISDNRKIVYVGQLPLNTTESTLINYFSEFGGIDNVFINNNRHFAFIRFAESCNAHNAVRNMNGFNINKQRVTCEMSKIQVIPQTESINPRNVKYRVNDSVYNNNNCNNLFDNDFHKRDKGNFRRQKSQRKRQKQNHHSHNQPKIRRNQNHKIIHFDHETKPILKPNNSHQNNKITHFVHQHEMRPIVQVNSTHQHEESYHRNNSHPNMHLHHWIASNNSHHIQQSRTNQKLVHYRQSLPQQIHRHQSNQNESHPNSQMSANYHLRYRMNPISHHHFRNQMKPMKHYR